MKTLQADRYTLIERSNNPLSSLTLYSNRGVRYMTNPYITLIEQSDDWFASYRIARIMYEYYKINSDGI